jgi:phage baseplate assembly protein W
MADLSRPYAGVRVDPRIGFGIVWPLRRNGRGDFAAGTGLELVFAGVAMVVGTLASGEVTDGEYAWNPEFGSLLELLRHRNNNETKREIARHYITEALTRFEPRVRLRDVDAIPEDVNGGKENAMGVRVRYDIVSSDGRQIIQANVVQDIPLQPPTTT